MNDRRPSALKRFLLIAFAAFVVIVGAPILAVGSSVAASGVITIEVQGPDSPHIYLPIPADAASALIEIAPRLLGDRERRELERARERVDVDREALLAVARALENGPEGTYVEVATDREQVTIRRVGRRFEVVVDDGEFDVRVAAPASFLRRSLERLL